MKSFAYHEAGHVVAARHMGFKVESTTIAENVPPLRATKTVRLNDYFDEEQLMFGRLVRIDGKAPTRHDLKIFYSLLVLKLAGTIAVEMAELNEKSGPSEHFWEDRAFTKNTLSLIVKEGIDKKYARIERIAAKLLNNRWSEVEALANRLLVEKTVYFN